MKKTVFSLKKDVGLKTVLLGLAAGFLNGLLGAGGGIILVRSAKYLLPGEKYDARDVFATALAVMLPVSAVSVTAYALRGEMNITGLGFFIFPAIIGGSVGAILLSKIDTRWLKLLFSVITVWSGISMLTR